MLNAIEEGLMNASAKQRLDDLETKKADIEISLAKEKIEKTPLTKEQIVFWISKFKNGNADDPAYRAALVDIFVNSIFLYEDKLVITFNWKDGSKTVTLKELESVSENDDNYDDSGGETGGKIVNAKNVIKINGLRCSHLDCSTPVIQQEK